MGQGVSKRQSYTPGETKDAGLPSGPVEVNGEVKTGANGQVELMSNKEVHGDELTDTSSAPVTPSTSSSSPTSPTDKKKKKGPRFVFSLKRTGSGKRSRKAKNEANGVRPVSYAAPASGAQAAKDTTRPQSMFLEDITIPEDEDGKIETVSLSSNDEHKEKKKDTSGKAAHRKTSPSSPKPKNDKKKGDSQKKKNSKRKEKEAKARAEKLKKEDKDKDKARKTSVEENNKVVEDSMNAAVAKMEELSSPEHTKPAPEHTISSPEHTMSSPEHTKPAPEHIMSSPEHTTPAPEHTTPAPEHTMSSPEHTMSSPEHTKPAPEHIMSSPEHTTPAPEHTMPEATVAGAAGAEVTLEVNAETKEVVNEEKEADIEVTSEDMVTKVVSPEVEIPDFGPAEAEAKATAPEEEEDHETDDVPALEGKVESVMEVSVAAVANSPIRVSCEDAAADHRLPEIEQIEAHHGEMAAQQEAAVSGLILVKEIHAETTVNAENEERSEGEKKEQHDGTLTKEEAAAHQPEGRLSLALAPPTGELRQEISQDEDEVDKTTGIIEVESIHISLPTDEEHVTTNVDRTAEICGAADVTSAIKKDAADAEEALGEKTELEAHASPSAAQPELPEAEEEEETIERKIEAAIESAPVGDTAERVTGSEVTLEAVKRDISEKEMDVAAEVLQPSEVAADAAAAAVVAAVPGHHEPSSAAAAAAPKPGTEDFPPPLSPTEMKAIEKERKLVKKREEKERARKEKEEKKRLKEQKKREAKEKKQKEKEEKDRKLREAREKLKVTSNMSVEVRNKADKTDAGAPPGDKTESDDTAGHPVGYVKVVAEEAIAPSRSSKARAAPSTSAAPKPSTSTAQAGLNVEFHTADKIDEPRTGKADSGKADLHQSFSRTDAERKDGSDEGVLGFSVKDIISSIEHNNVVVSSSSNVEAPAERVDETQPPAVPDSPYPDEEEEEEECSSPSSSEASSPVSTLSPFSSAPQSPAGVDASPGKTPISPETGESARSGVLRKIELGPRLRTAILRKSSSGAESEEKRVSLTAPRHVQVSDLTPPPRKQGPRRPLQQAWSPLGAYNARSPQPQPRPVEEDDDSSALSPSPEPSSRRDEEPSRPAVAEEVVTAVASAASAVEAVPPSAVCQTASLNAENEAEEEEGEADADADCRDNEEFSAMTDLVTPGSRASIHADPESPTIVSVASIVLGAGVEEEEAGEEEVEVVATADAFHSADPPHRLPEADTAGSRDDDDVTVDAVQRVQTNDDCEVHQHYQPSETALQKMATDLVTQVQRAAQAEAAAAATTTTAAVPEDGGDVSVSRDVSDRDVMKGGVDDEEEEEEEADCAAESHSLSSVRCSAELRKESADGCCVVVVASSSSDDCCATTDYSAVMNQSAAAALIVDDLRGSSSAGKDTMESLLNRSRDDDGVVVSVVSENESSCCYEQVPEEDLTLQSDLRQHESQVSEAASVPPGRHPPAATGPSSEVLIIQGACEDRLGDRDDGDDDMKEDLSTSTLSSEIEAELDEDTAEQPQQRQSSKNYYSGVSVGEGADRHHLHDDDDDDDDASSTLPLEREDATAAQTPCPSTTPRECSAEEEESSKDRAEETSQEPAAEVSLLSSSSGAHPGDAPPDKVLNGRAACSVLAAAAAHNGSATTTTTTTISDEVQDPEQQQEEEEDDDDDDEQKRVNGGEKMEGEAVTVTTSCNGSHALRLAADSNETIDAYLKLQSGLVVGEGKKLADTLETNNNDSGGPAHCPAVQTEASCSSSTTTTSSSSSSITINVTSDSSTDNVG